MNEPTNAEHQKQIDEAIAAGTAAARGWRKRERGVELALTEHSPLAEDAPPPAESFAEHAETDAHAETDPAPAHNEPAQEA